MEWYCSLIYWLWFRFLIVYESPDFQQFALAVALHFAAEGVKSSLCALRCCYSARMRVFHQIGSSENGDDSTIDEWNARNALDVVTRWFAAMVSGVVVLVYLAVITESGFLSSMKVSAGPDGGGREYAEALQRTAILTVMEIAYYAVSVVVNVWCSGFNALYPFINYVNSMTVAHTVFMLVLYLSVLSLLRFM